MVKGQSIEVNKHYFAIVGVMPRDFHEVTVDTAPDLWIPLRALPPMVNFSEQRMYLELVGCLRPGFTRLQAQAESRTTFQSTMKDYFQNICSGDVLIAAKFAGEDTGATAMSAGH